MRVRLYLFLALALSVAMAGLASRASAQGSPAPAAAPSYLATADGETSGMQVQVKQLKVVGGDTLMLPFMLANNSDNAFNMPPARRLSTGDRIWLRRRSRHPGRPSQ